MAVSVNLVHDLQELFWDVYDLVTKQKIPPMIVVGVDHAGKDRAYEYLPYKDYAQEDDPREPAGRRFPDFLTSEVMPLVDGQYRTLQGQSNTGIGGSSYGGVATLYALMTKPGRFGYGMIESPSLQVGMGPVVRDTHPLIPSPVKVFVATGGKEAGVPAIDKNMAGRAAAESPHFPVRRVEGVVPAAAMTV